jgi:hypothetical protein
VDEVKSFLSNLHKVLDKAPASNRVSFSRRISFHTGEENGPSLFRNKEGVGLKLSNNVQALYLSISNSFSRFLLGSVSVCRS